MSLDKVLERLRQPNVPNHDNRPYSIKKFAELKGEQTPFAGHVNPGRKREAVMYDSEADSKDNSDRWAKRFLTTEDLMRIAFELRMTQLTSIEVISYERNWSAVEVFVSFEQERISQESINGTNNQAAATA